MEKNSSTFNFKKIPAAFISAVLLFFAVQHCVTHSGSFWRFCYDYSKPLIDDPIRVEAQLQLASRVKDKSKIFLTGSSEVREGFDVERLNSDFKQKNVVFYNLGFSAAHPVDMFMMADRFLKAGPGVIVYMHDPRSFYSDYAFSKMPYYFNENILGPMFKYLGMQTILMQRRVLWDAMLRQWLPLYRYRESLKRICRNWVRSCFAKKSHFNGAAHAYETAKPKAYFLKVIETEPKKQYAVTGMSLLSQDLFTRFSQDVVSRGVRLVTLEAPLYPLIDETYDQRIYDENDAFLKGQAQKTGFVYLKTAPGASFQEGDFIDFTHLNQRGREKLTLFLEEYLRSANT